jgi:HlyD family secretion protein
VESIHYNQGDTVRAGDLLFVIAHQKLLVQKEAVIAELDKALERLELLRVFRDSVEKGQNLFDQQESANEEYRTRFLQYQIQSQLLEREINQTYLEKEQVTRDNNLQLRIFDEESKEIIDKLANTQLLERSIYQEKNLFSDTSNEYAQRYLDYTLNYQRLERVVIQRRRNYEISSKLADAVPRLQVIEDKEQFELALLEQEKYKNEYLLSLNQQKSQLEERLRGITQNKDQSVRSLDRLETVIKSKEIALKKLTKKNIHSLMEKINLRD